MTTNTKTIEQVRDEFHRAGRSFAEWARDNEFNRKLVYDILAGRRRALRGQSHDIAVELGLKKGDRRLPRRAPTPKAARAQRAKAV
jgi:gp16 family phage-associated protein